MYSEKNVAKNCMRKIQRFNMKVLQITNGSIHKLKFERKKKNETNKHIFFKLRQSKELKRRKKTTEN